MIIEIIDVVDCKIGPALADIIKPVLSFPAVFYKQGPWKKIRTEYEKSTLEVGKDDDGKKCYYFRTGLLPRVLDFCKQNNVPIEIVGEEEKLEHFEPVFDPKIFTDNDRKEIQFRQITKALKTQRGVLIAPTGTGKTMTGLALLSTFLTTKNIRVLWLCHTKDLMYQSGENAKNKFNIDVGYVGDGKQDTSKQLTCATRQSMIKLIADIGWEFDVVVVDEVHHVSGVDGEYAEILKGILSPVRIGLTATMPKTKEALLAIEGLIGPIIDEATIKEAQDKGLMANIKIKLIKIPKDHSIKDLRRYDDVYETAVVNRVIQHRMIAETAKKHVDVGDSVLIVVKRILHGNNLLAELTRLGVNSFFALGVTESGIRMKVKEALNDKSIPCVVASLIWKEGVDIPELDVIINAAGGKSEIQTLQTLGRGLRKTAKKKELLLYDTFDLSHNFLVSHLAERLNLYMENDWI